MISEHPLVLKLIDLALEEDLGGGDLTSQLTVPENHSSQGRIIAREELVVCGLMLVAPVLSRLDPVVQVQTKAAEGQEVQPGTVLCEINGLSRALLGGERTVLNFLQRLSGVATFTRRFMRHNPGLEILDTRKTTPGWRLLEKMAVKTGGGHNHRQNLSDMILVKNNHIDAALQQGLTLVEVFRKVKQEKPQAVPFEIEVRNMTEIEAALAVGPDMIMLDNMNDQQVAEAVPVIRRGCPACRIEVSGGVEADRLARLAELGVDCISVGALTRKAVCVDISMRIVSVPASSVVADRARAS